MTYSSSFITRSCAFGLAALVVLAGATASAQEPLSVSVPVAESAPAAAAGETMTSLSHAELDAFLERFAAMSGLSAKFREEKQMALLAAPLVNEGVIYFAPPGRLARHTTSPLASSMIIDGSRLTFGDARGVEAIGFEQNPVLGLFVSSFVKIFAGDRDALAQMYSMELQGSPEGAWLLKLRPRLSPMDKVIEGIELRGEGLVVSTMVVHELGGDTTTTTFTEVDTGRSFSAAEQTKLFRIPR